MAQTIYLGRDNKLYPVLQSGGSAYSLTDVTKMSLHFDDTEIDSDTYPNAIDFTTEAETGEVVLQLGPALETAGVEAGMYRAELYVFTALETNGVFWEYITFRVVDLDE